MKKRTFTAITAGICSLVMMFSLAQAMDVHFHWGASTGQVDGYKIYWGDTQGGPYQNLLCEVNGTTLNCIASLDETQEYCLICRAFNDYGESGDSNEVRWSYAIPGIPGKLQWSIDLVELMRNIGADQIQFVSRQ
jgi:hypothetical protein